MQNFIKKYLATLGFFLAVIIVASAINNLSYKNLNVGNQSAAVFNPTDLPSTAKPASGFAWNDNVGWINFGTTTSSEEGRVYVSNNRLYGYAWGENIGWISMNCANTEVDNNCSTYGVTQTDSDGILTGKAWGENIGWIDFAPTGGGVNITTNIDGVNTFSGYAWGENIGWISFSGTAEDNSTYGVETDWNAPSYVFNYAADNSVDTGSTITGSSTQKVAVGGNGTAVTASSSSHYHFVNWSDNSTENPRTDTNAADNLSLTANFAIDTKTLSYSAGDNGFINGSSTQILDYGTTGSAVTASSSLHHHFVNWSDGATSTTRTDIANSNLSVTANFATTTYTLSYSADNSVDPDGIIIGSSTQIVIDGNSGTEVRASSSPKYHFLKWSDNSSSNPRTDINITNDIYVTASFEGNGGGVVIPNCIYNNPAWGACTHTPQTRTLTATNQPCSDETTKIESQTCIVPIEIYISPSTTTTIYVGDKIQFAATVTGTTTNNGVTWILPDEGSGTIDPNGLYTAPQTGGIFHVLARPVADISKSVITIVDVRLKPTCTAYNYSDWSACINSVQSRIATSSIPENCSGGTAQILTQACMMEATTTATTTCTSYTYSSWSDCLNDSQSRTTLTSIPTGCIGGENPINTQSCVVTPITIIPEAPIVPEEPDGDTSSDNPPTKGGGGSNRPGGSSSSGSSTGGTLQDIANILDISSIVTNNVAVLGTTTQQIVAEAQKILKSPAGSAVAKTITTAGVVGGSVAASSVFVLNGTAVADILFLPFKLWGLLLSVLGLRKRNRPWGTVYDSVTKQPIDPAYVTLNMVGSKEENMSITDLDGRYGFLVAPGKYTLTANKTNYTFPSVKMANKTEDALYNNLYFGEELNIETFGALINKNIPLDPIKFDWNEFVKGDKKMMKFYSKRDKMIRIITDWIFRIGFVVSLVSLFLVAAPYNLIILGLYIILALLRKFGLRQKALGSLAEKDGTPLSFAIIRIMSPDLNIMISSKVADKIGKYYCLVPKGKYLVKIEKKNDDESYTEVFTSPVFDAPDGIINKSFTI